MPQVQISAHKLADIIIQVSPYFLLCKQNPCDSRKKCIGNTGRLPEVGITEYRRNIAMGEM